MAKNEAKIKFTAETGQFNQEIQNANREMSELKAELKLNETQMKATGATVEALERKHSILEDQLKASENKTEALNQKVQKAVEIFGENSTEASKLRTQLLNAQTAEEKLRQEVAKCENELKQQDDALEDAGDSAKGAADGFDIAKGAIADLASEAIQAAIGKVSEFIDYLKELPEATREIRQDMATLDTSFEKAGLSAEQGTQTWKDLYRVFGEDDRAVEAANLIAKMSDNQQDLNNWVTITQGIWGSYQDSLPVEGLAEASMETAKTGEVTGVLADALNWSSEAATMFADYMSEDVTTAEGAFNEALKKCTTEEERQALITETLTALYGDAAAKYEEASGAQLDAKEATAENILVQNELADTLEPVTTAWQEMKTDALEAFQPVIESVSGAMVSAMDWMREHPVLLKVVGAALGVVAAALVALTVVVTAFTVAQWAMNSAILANPITWIIVAVIAAIAAVIAIIVLVIEYWDEIVAAVKKCWESVKETLSVWGEWIDANVIQPVIAFFTSLWDGIKNIWDGICNAIQTAWDFICNLVTVGVQLVGSILTAAFQIITLPFRFIWENCKEYVFAAWEWIKSKISTAINAVRNVISTVMNAIKTVFSTIWNAIKSVVSSVWNSIKSVISTAVNSVKTTVSNVWNTIKNATSTAFNTVKNTALNIWNGIKTAISNVVNGVKSTVSNIWNSIKTATSNAFNSVKSTATTVWNNIKSAILTPIEAARDKIKGVVDAIKGFFSNMNISLPNIKLPHFKVTGKLSISPPSVPKLSIDWYKDGGIMVNPTIFGMNGNHLMAGGEAGPEAILPIDKLEDYISGAIEKTMNVVNLESLANAIEDLANRPISMNINGRQFAYATASDTDSVGGMRSTFRSRGLAVE